MVTAHALLKPLIFPPNLTSSSCPLYFNRVGLGMIDIFIPSPARFSVFTSSPYFFHNAVLALSFQNGFSKPCRWKNRLGWRCVVVRIKQRSSRTSETTCFRNNRSQQGKNLTVRTLIMKLRECTCLMQFVLDTLLCMEADLKFRGLRPTSASLTSNEVETDVVVLGSRVKPLALGILMFEIFVFEMVLI